MDFETIHKIHILGLEDIAIKYVKKNVSKEDYDKILEDYSEYSFVTSILMSAIHHQRDLVNKFLSLSVMELIPYLESTKIQKNTKRKIPTKSGVVEAKRVKTEEITNSSTQSAVNTSLSPKPFNLIKADPYNGNMFMKPRYCKYLNLMQIKILKRYAKKYTMLLNSDIEIIVVQLNTPKYKNKTNQESVEKWLAVNGVILDKYNNLDMSKFDVMEAPKPKKIAARKKSIYTNWQLNTLQKYYRKCKMPSLEMCHVIVEQLNSPKYKNDKYNLDVGDIYKYFQHRRHRDKYIKTLEPIQREKLIDEDKPVRLTEVKYTQHIKRTKFIALPLKKRTGDTFVRKSRNFCIHTKDKLQFSASQLLCLTLCATNNDKIPKEDVMLRLSHEIDVPLGEVKRWMINYFHIATY